jgi:hypothetical protein
VVEQGGLGHVAEVLLDLNGRQVELIQVQDGDPPSRPSLTALAVRRDDTRWSKSSRLKPSLSSSPSLMIPLRTPASMPRRHAPPCHHAGHRSATASGPRPLSRR